MVRVSAWAGLRRFKGVGSWFGILLAYSRSSWSPIKASWWPQARATLSLILREEKAGVFRIHHKYGKLNKNLFYKAVFARGTSCPSCVFVFGINSRTGAGAGLYSTSGCQGPPH